MKRQFKINVNGKTYDVELGDLSASPVSVTVDGKEYSVTIDSGASAPVVHPVFQAVSPVAAIPVPAPAAPRPAPAPVAAGSGDDVRSPMPGVIHDVMVKAGDKVTPGQQLCALEAMKMKSAIRSPRDATIASVEVTNGQKVAFGDVLVRFA